MKISGATTELRHADSGQLSRSSASASIWSGERSALLTFVGVELLGFVLLLYWARHAWFGVDDWDFLAQRTGGNIGDLFRAHYEHWTTLPILVYRTLWWLVGLHYTPYLVIAVALHLTTAALLRVVMRRAGVNPWLSTLVASSFVFFGPGSQNILSAFQMTVVGSVVFGLTDLLLMDHNGPLDWRDLLGMLAGLAAIMCSGVGVTMVFVVGLAALLRRGWRIALAHTVPLGCAYLVWFGAVGHEAKSGIGSPTPGVEARFVIVGLRASLQGLAHFPGGGLVLAVLLVLGLVSVFRTRGGAVAREANATLALLAGAVVLLVITGIARAGPLDFAPANSTFTTGAETARNGRYVYLTAALSLPALAFAANALVRRRRLLAVLVICVFVVGLPSNIHQLVDFGRRYQQLDPVRQSILAAPRLPLARRLPRSIEPSPDFAPGATLGWLLDSAGSGRIPEPRNMTAIARADELLRLALQPFQGTTTVCRPLHRPLALTLRAGQAVSVRGGPATIQFSPLQGAQSHPESIPPRGLIARGGPIPLRINPGRAPGVSAMAICTEDRLPESTG